MPAVAAHGVVVDAVGMAIAMLGKRSVTLTGFSPLDAQPQPWTHPAVPFISAPNSPMDVIGSMISERRRGRVALVIGVALVALICFAAGALYSSLKLPQLKDGNVSWSVVAIDKAGVVVATKAGRVAIPVGGHLPNGEVILSVHPGRRAAMLSNGTLMLHTPAAGSGAQSEGKQE